MGTIFGESAHEILPGLWVGDAASAPIAIARDFAVLNVLETGAIPGESHIPILVPLIYRSPADGVLAYRVRLDDAVNWIEENKSRPMLVHCGAGVERSPLTVIGSCVASKSLPIWTRLMPGSRSGDLWSRIAASGLNRCREGRASRLAG
jgi:protein-tyrosine phosphatase